MGKQLWCWLAQENIKLEMTKEANQREEHTRRETPKELHTEGGREERNNTEQ
jgi:hypothetical protein